MPTVAPTPTSVPAPAPASRIAGTLDPAFGRAGIVVLGDSANHYYSHSAALQNDGKLVVAGVEHNVAAVMRFDPDGTLDATFGSNGAFVANPERNGALGAVGLALQPDGKILAGWGAPKELGPQTCGILRLNPDGTPDDSFGSGGVSFLSFGEISWCSPVLMDNGRMLAVGSISYGATIYEGLIAGLTSDGSIDPKFGTNGVILDPSVWDYYGAVRDAAGNIITLGHWQPRCYPNCGYTIARFLPDGQLDSSFSGGRVSAILGASSMFQAIVPTPQGFLPAGVEYGDDARKTSSMLMASTNADGSLDSSFGNESGYEDLTFGTNEAISSIAIDGSSIYASAVSNAPSERDSVLLARFNAYGVPDTTFGTKGLVTVSLPAPLLWYGAPTMLVQPDHRLVLVGNASDTDGVQYLVMLRFE